ncbi:MAG: CPBP family intramembrane glutamic endopeptidase, partial [Pseudoxanthomonas sp.]
MLAVFAYSAWVMAVWIWRGVDYREIASEANLMLAVIQPLGIAAILLSIFNTWAGWWRATLFETPRLRRPVLRVVLLLPMMLFIAITLWTTDFTAIPMHHLALIAAATLLVGFCEEMTTRGILLVALRGSCRSEAWIWFGSSAMFGLLHATNGFFGIRWLSLMQVILAFCVGTGLYLLRRLNGTLLLPMLVHAMWDFSTLASDLDQVPGTVAASIMAVLTYVLSLVLVFVVLRGGRRVEENSNGPRV